MKSRGRGEYRPIFEAIFDGKDYRELPSDCRLILLTLKGTLGACGIKSVPGLIGVLQDRTGMSSARIRKALVRLQESAWIEVEHSVVWVVRGFEFEPSLVAANSKHCTFVGNVVASLPRVPIVDRFRARYVEWFGTVGDTLSDRVSNGNSIGSRITSPTPTTTPTTELPAATADRVRRALLLPEHRIAFGEILKRTPGPETFSANVERLAGVAPSTVKIATYSWDIIGSAMIDLAQKAAPATALPSYCKSAASRRAVTPSSPGELSAASKLFVQLESESAGAVHDV